MNDRFSHEIGSMSPYAARPLSEHDPQPDGAPYVDLDVVKAAESITRRATPGRIALFGGKIGNFMLKGFEKSVHALSSFASNPPRPHLTGDMSRSDNSQSRER